MRAQRCRCKILCPRFWARVRLSVLGFGFVEEGRGVVVGGAPDLGAIARFDNHAPRPRDWPSPRPYLAENAGRSWPQSGSVTGTHRRRTASAASCPSDSTAWRRLPDSCDWPRRQAREAPGAVLKFQASRTTSVLHVNSPATVGYSETMSAGGAHCKPQEAPACHRLECEQWNPDVSRLWTVFWRACHRIALHGAECRSPIDSQARAPAPTFPTYLLTCAQDMGSADWLN